MCSKKTETILGLDPGTAVTGFGVIVVEGNRLHLVDFGTIRPPASLSLHARYRLLHEGVLALIETHAPTAFSIETQYVSKNVQSALKLGQAKGVATLAAALREIPIFEYAPAVAKKAVVGNGQASKEQVQQMIQRLLHLQALPTPQDAADALALAICHAHRRRHV